MADTTTAVDEVLQELMSRIVGGVWTAGQPTATERALTQELGASRATVRSALARLIEWNVLQARQGSGTYVQPRQYWRLGVLPLALQTFIGLGRVDEVVRALQDGLRFRRAFVLDLLERAAPTLQGAKLDSVRDAIARAWEAREDLALFLKHDHMFLIGVVEAAGMLYSMWLLNDIRRTYESVVTGLAMSANPPESFVPLHLETIDALERGDGSGARAAFERYLDDLDARLAQALPETFAQQLLGGS